MNVSSRIVQKVQLVLHPDAHPKILMVVSEMLSEFAPEIHPEASSVILLKVSPGNLPEICTGILREVCVKKLKFTSKTKY